MSYYSVVTNYFQIMLHHLNLSNSFKKEYKTGRRSHHIICQHLLTRDIFKCQVAAHTYREFSAASQHDRVFVLWAEAENLQRTHTEKEKQIVVNEKGGEEESAQSCCSCPAALTAVDTDDCKPQLNGS